MKNFENQSMVKTFFKYAAPSIIGLLIVSMQIMIDGIFVGNYVGSRGLAAINISMPYINSVMSIAIMIISGGCVISSIELGRDNKKRASEVASFTLMCLVIIISVISIISIISIDKLVLALGANAELAPMVKEYLIPFIVLSIFYQGILFTENFARVGGRPNAVFLSGITACSVNVALDYLFIAKLGMGISGAAIATVIANFAGVLALIGLYFKNRSSIQLTKPKGDMKLLKNMLFNGSSEMFSFVSGAIATLFFNKIIMANIGELGISALTIVFYVNGIVNISLFGLSQALQPIISYNLGAKRIEKIYEVLKIAFITGGGFGVLAFILMKTNALSLINLFTKGDVELTNIAMEAMSFFIFAYLMSFVNIIATAFHTAIEKPLESSGIAILRSLVFVVGFLMIMPNIVGNKGIWMAVPLAELTCLLISLSLMRISFKRIDTVVA